VAKEVEKGGVKEGGEGETRRMITFEVDEVNKS
jgi:hypothetical protein